MPFKPGDKRKEGAGRKKGKLNKNTQTLVDKAKELGVDPFEILLLFAGERWKKLGYDSRTITKYSSDGSPYEEYTISPELRQKAAAEACQYINPKRKAIEHSGLDGSAIQIQERRNQTLKILSDPETLALARSLEKKLSDSKS